MTSADNETDLTEIVFVKPPPLSPTVNRGMVLFSGSVTLRFYAISQGSSAQCWQTLGQGRRTAFAQVGVRVV